MKKSIPYNGVRKRLNFNICALRRAACSERIYALCAVWLPHTGPKTEDKSEQATLIGSTRRLGPIPVSLNSCKKIL